MNIDLVDMLPKKYSLALKILPIVIVLVLIKAGIIYYGFPEINPGPLLTTFIGGAIFLIGFLLAGTLSDYKESEKLPSDIAISLKTLYDDFRLTSLKNKDIFIKPQAHIRKLATDIRESLTTGQGITKTIFDDIDAVKNDINEFAEADVQSGYIIKMRNELTTTEKAVRRIKVIKDTSFIPAAYAIVEILVGMIVLMLLVSQIGTILESSIILFIIPFLMIYMVMLIKDIDDPFEGGSIADVDLTTLEDVENYLNNN